MSQADTLLSSVFDNPSYSGEAQWSNEEHIVIDSDRFVTVPEKLQRIAVQHDHDIETVTFDCPRYWDGHDMSQMTVYVNYLRPDGVVGCYACRELRIDTTDSNIIHFNWTVSRHATTAKGHLTFLVCIKNVDNNGTEINHWNSELNREITISEGLECEEILYEMYPDVITQLLTGINNILSSGMVASVDVAKVDDTATITLNVPDYNNVGQTIVKTIELHDGRNTVYVGSGDMPEGYSVQIDPNGNGWGSPFYYGTCDTSANTTTKVVACDGFVLETGAVVGVRFTYANSASSSPLLNVNSTGAKYIKKYGTTAISTYFWSPGSMVMFIYDGSYWVMLNGTTASTSYYGITKLADSTDSNSTTLAATANSVRKAYEAAIKTSLIISDDEPESNSTIWFDTST